MQIRFKKTHPLAKTPTRAHATDAGADLYAVAEVVIPPQTRAVVPTGLVMALPAGYYGRIAPRSGLAVKSGIDVLAGVVDSSYRGEIGVVLQNLGDFKFVVQPGNKIAQLIVEQCAPATFAEVAELDATERNAGGFGSTGL